MLGITKTHISNPEVGQQGFEGLLWGPIVYGPDPFTRGESKGPSRGGLWPKPNNIKHKIALGYSRGPLSPRQTQSPTGKRGKNGIELNLKENLKYPEKAAPTAIQYSAPDRAAFFGFLQPPPTTLSMD